MNVIDLKYIYLSQISMTRILSTNDLSNAFFKTDPLSYIVTFFNWYYKQAQPGYDRHREAQFLNLTQICFAQKSLSVWIGSEKLGF